MKSIDAILKYGNLYDRETKKRILIEDGSELSIVLNEHSILTEDPNIKIKEQELLNSDKKLNSVLISVDSSTRVWKLYERGQELYFGITAGVKKKNVTNRIFSIFRVQLLEDLYLYNKIKDDNHARFFECRCVVESCLNNSIEYFEKLDATSLNDAYTKTYELYFAMYGKSTCNAFDRFFEYKDLITPIRGKTKEIQKKPSVR